jgi:hypothetical protein
MVTATLIVVVAGTGLASAMPKRGDYRGRIHLHPGQVSMRFSVFGREEFPRTTFIGGFHSGKFPLTCNRPGVPRFGRFPSFGPGPLPNNGMFFGGGGNGIHTLNAVWGRVHGSRAHGYLHILMRTDVRRCEIGGPGHRLRWSARLRTRAS